MKKRGGPSDPGNRAIDTMLEVLDDDPPLQSLGRRPSVDPLVALLDVLVWVLCAAFALGVAFSYFLAVLP